MKKDDEKLIRQLSLVSFLLNRTWPAQPAEIQSVVEGYATMSDVAFKKRFFEDRADLAATGIAIESVSADDSISEAYYLPKENYYLPDLALTDEELTALRAALYLLQGRFAYERPLRLALANLTRGTPTSYADEMARVAVILDSDEEGSRYGRLLDRLEAAVTRRKTVVFNYRKPGQTTARERTIDPYGLFLIGGHWYTVGRDHSRDANRMFRVSRIEGLLRHKSKKKSDFPPPRDFDSDAYLARPPWLLGEHKGNARLRADEDVSWWLERTYPRMRVVQWYEDGSALFDTPYADADALVSFVLGLGSKVTIEHPPSLRSFMLQVLQRIRDSHRLPSTAATGEPSTAGGAQPGAAAEVPAVTPDRAGATDSTGGGRPAMTSTTSLDPVAPEAREKQARSSAAVSPDRLGRALTLLYYLLEVGRDDAVPLARITRDLGLTRAEVAEDISLLNVVNSGGGQYVIFAELEKDRVLVINEALSDHLSAPARLTPLMAKALLLALDLVGPDVPLRGHASVASAREKIAAVCEGVPASGDVRLESPHCIDSLVLCTLNEAIRSQRLVDIEYYTRSSERLALRTVEPHVLHRSRDSWYLEAFCRKADDRRTFRLDLIRSATLLEETFALRSELWPSTHRPASPEDRSEAPAKPSMIAPGRSRLGWAVLRTSAEEVPFMEDLGLAARKTSTGEVEVTLPFLDRRWLATELLRLAGRAVLVSPADLRVEVADTAERLRRAYEE